MKLCTLIISPFKQFEDKNYFHFCYDVILLDNFPHPK